MANYITIAPQYNPFSLQELLAIPMMYTEAYNKAQEQYDAYQDKVAALRAYAKDSPAAASMLNAYDTGIQDLTNAMASGRWNTNVANQSRRLRSLYREQIIPLSIGATAFDTYRQNRLKRNDGTLIGRDYTLEDFINNPTLEDNSLLGSAIQSEAMKAAAVEAAGRQVNTPWKLDRTRGGQYWTHEAGNGYTSAERAAFLQNPNDAQFNNLTAIRQQLRDKLGYSNRTKAEQEQIDNYITRGIYDGMVGNVQWHDSSNIGYGRYGGSGGSGGRRTNTSTDGGSPSRPSLQADIHQDSDNTFNNPVYYQYLSKPDSSYSKKLEQIYSLAKNYGIDFKFTELDQYSASYTYLDETDNNKPKHKFIPRSGGVNRSDIDKTGTDPYFSFHHQHGRDFTDQVTNIVFGANSGKGYQEALTWLEEQAKKEKRVIGEVAKMDRNPVSFYVARKGDTELEGEAFTKLATSLAPKLGNGSFRTISGYNKGKMYENKKLTADNIVSISYNLPSITGALSDGTTSLIVTLDDGNQVIVPASQYNNELAQIINKHLDLALTYATQLNLPSYVNTPTKLLGYLHYHGASYREYEDAYQELMGTIDDAILDYFNSNKTHHYTNAERK